MPDLPADLSQWPDDPYRLLDLPRSADVPTAKRAYLKLIRLYKPEHEPEKFQRIRAAFEEIQARIAFHRQYGIPLDPEAPPAAPQADAAPASGAELNDQGLAAADERPAAPSAEELPATEATFAAGDGERRSPPPDNPEFAPLDAAWALAIEGDPAAAVAALQARAGDEPSGAAHARLYWLATLFPSASPKHATQWLVEGLTQTHLMGPLRELFRRVVLAQPAEALREECAALLTVPTQAGPLVDFADIRWLAAGRLGAMKVILQDLEVFRPRVAPLDDETWARLLLLAVDQLAWADPVQYGGEFDRLCHEVDGMSQIHVVLADQLHRLDMLRAIEADWRQLPHACRVPPRWQAALPLCWFETWDVIRQELTPLAGEIAANPRKGLEWFDDLRRASHPCAALLGGALERLRTTEAAEEDFRADEEAQLTAVAEFAARPFAQYDEMRVQFLFFCLREAIELEAAARILDGLALHGRHAVPWNWGDQLAEDGPLRYVYAACRLWNG